MRTTELAQRRRKIFEVIRDRKQITVPELSRMFNLSEASIRTDLKALEEEKRIRRFHGGAEIASRSLYQTRLDQYREEKGRIVEQALSHIEEQDTIFLDTGTTIHLLAERLIDVPHLTIITNSLPVASLLDEAPAKRLIVIGGEYDYSEKCFVGMLTDSAMSNIYANKTFISADSVSVEQGVFSSGLTHIGYVKHVIAHSRQTILLADSSKFDRIGPVRIASISDVDVVISDKKLPQEKVAQIKEKGASVELV